ncbi:uncharacterized protein BJ212DRAFT_1303662 [Suillus subaureus]|uniref:Uncharacterized protein n=1 Tax=Suillus subaureus TaxID=48587 RepID=A0A9P7J7J4_9AGAM|nr:uncharacterized protein BJ212DRAFT_1303662 [Suillus subaureus]KAG1807013.1 hypothetical protein BJ212DRAFT_1303662 [Suillus subaureus]
MAFTKEHLVRLFWFHFLTCFWTLWTPGPGPWTGHILEFEAFSSQKLLVLLWSLLATFVWIFVELQLLEFQLSSLFVSYIFSNWAQAAVHQAERNQRNIGSPPAHYHPAPIARPLENALQMNISQILGNLNHGPIPMQRFPGLPHNVIEHHEAQHMWHQHHPLPQPGPPIPAPALGPPFGQPVPALPLGQPFGQSIPAPPLGPPFGYIPPPAMLLQPQ